MERVLVKTWGVKSGGVCEGRDIGGDLCEGFMALLLILLLLFVVVIFLMFLITFMF